MTIAGKKAKEKSKKLVWLGVLSLVTTLVWVALDSYHQLVAQGEPEKVSHLIEPLNPELDDQVLEEIEARREYQIGEVEKYLSPLISLPEEEGVGSPSGSATESGEKE